MLEAYRKHVEERAAQGVVPQPLNAEQTAGLVELLKNPPAGEEEFLLDLITNRVPPGVDEAAYVKAGYLSAVVKGEAASPLIDANLATTGCIRRNIAGRGPMSVARAIARPANRYPDRPRWCR